MSDFCDQGYDHSMTDMMERAMKALLDAMIARLYEIPAKRLTHMEKMWLRDAEMLLGKRK